MSDLSWTIPVMRAGYAGRGITYTAIAGLSLWAIWSGGDAEGTSSAMERLSNSGWGVAVLALIAAGLFAYAIWRGIDAVEDLEDYGDDAKGLISRTGMVVTGLLHGAIGGLAVAFAMGRDSSGGGIPAMVGKVMEWPGGRVLVTLAGLVTIGAGIYYLHKGWKAKYREKLRANHFTSNYDWALRFGVMAQGAVILIIGGFFTVAGFRGNSQEAGGMGKAFDWLSSQPFGNVLVVILCVGLLGFAFFCFVNAAYRIIEKVPHDDITSLKAEIKAAT